MRNSVRLFQEICRCHIMLSDITVCCFEYKICRCQIMLSDIMICCFEYKICRCQIMLSDIMVCWFEYKINVAKFPLKTRVEYWHISVIFILNKNGYLSTFSVILGNRGSTVVKVLCYKSEGRWFDHKFCQWIFY